MFNPSFSNFLTKRNICATQHLIVNKNVNENDDVDDDDYNFFWKKETGKK